MVRVTRDHEMGVDLLNIAGQFGQSGGTELRIALLELVSTGSGKLVLNLSGVTFVDSFGLATLVSVWNAMERRGGRAVLSTIPRDIEAMIELTRLQSLFEIFPSNETAIASLSGANLAVIADGLYSKPIRDEALSRGYGGVFTVPEPRSSRDCASTVLVVP